MALTWTQQSAPGGITAQTLSYAVVDPINGVTFLMTSGGATYRSTNGCQSTSTVSPGDTPACVGYGNGVWLVGTNAGIRRSTDGGVTWSANISYGTSFGPAQWLIFSPSFGSGSGMWVAIGNGSNANTYSTSTDGGLTWSASATISGVLATVQQHSFGIPVGWDGTSIWYTGIRNTGNTQTLVATFNGSTWSTSNIDAVGGGFGDCGSITYISALTTYLAIATSSRTIRTASTLAGLGSASNFSLSTNFPNSTTMQGQGGTDLFFIANGNSAEAAELHSGTWTNDTLPFTPGTNRFVASYVWDQKNGFVIGSGGGSSYVLITAPYKGFASTLGSVSVAAGEGGIQLSTSEGTGGQWDVNGIIGGNSTFGTISSTGFYTAPNVPPANPIVIARNTLQGLQVVTAINLVLPYIGGQVLGPRGQPGQLNPNVNAPAGIGGDLWGANGGGITPAGGGVTGQTGYDRPIAVTMSDAERRTTYQIIPNNPPLVQQTSKAAIPTTTTDSSLPPGGGSSG